MATIFCQIPDDEDFDVKSEPGLSSVVIFDEALIKKEENGKSLEHVTQGRPPAKIYTKPISMDVVVGEIPDYEDVGIKRETKQNTVVIFDEVHVKQEVQEESLEHSASGSSLDEGFHSSIRYEVEESSDSVKCNICWRYCKDAEGLIKHQEVNSDCKQHSKGFRSVYSLGETSGIVEYYKDAIPSDVRSDSSSNLQSFVEPLEITANIKASSTGKCHTCHICKKSFSRKGRLNTHILIHTGERPFTCDVCNQTFTRNCYLNTHKLIHSGKRPFTCDVCNQTFTQRSSLNTHKLKHTGERPFFCNVCNHTFSQKGPLNRHKLLHTGERPFSCDVCNKTFIQKNHLNKHKLLHAGE